jgi:hypothetical protein
VVLVGGTPNWTVAEEQHETEELSLEDLVFRALGLSRAATDDAGGGKPWLPDGASAVPGVLAMLQAQGCLDPDHLQRLLADSTDTALMWARDQARQLMLGLPPAVRALEQRRGRGAFGLGLFRSIPITIPECCFFTTLCLMLESQFGVRPLEVLRSVMPDLAAAVEAAAADRDRAIRETTPTARRRGPGGENEG